MQQDWGNEESVSTLDLYYNFEGKIIGMKVALPCINKSNIFPCIYFHLIICDKVWTE